LSYAAIEAIADRAEEIFQARKKALQRRQKAQQRQRSEKVSLWLGWSWIAPGTFMLGRYRDGLEAFVMGSGEIGSGR
jgi:hypothetical protein